MKTQSKLKTLLESLKESFNEQMDVLVNELAQPRYTSTYDEATSPKQEHP